VWKKRSSFTASSLMYRKQETTERGEESEDSSEERERENLKMGDERVTPGRGSQKSSLNATKHSLSFEAKSEK